MLWDQIYTFAHKLQRCNVLLFSKFKFTNIKTTHQKKKYPYSMIGKKKAHCSSRKWKINNSVKTWLIWLLAFNRSMTVCAFYVIICMLVFSMKRLIKRDRALALLVTFAATTSQSKSRFARDNRWRIDRWRCMALFNGNLHENLVWMICRCSFSF